MNSTVIVAGARTPVGKLLGTLADRSAVELGGHAIRAALSRSSLEATDAEAVYLGNVVQAGVGPNPARLAAIAAGVPLSTPATTINKLCLSGLTAVAHADLAIRDGLASIVVAGGTESMTNAPHLARVRKGVKYGATEVVDALEEDALLCGIDHELMGAATDRYQRALGLSRIDQDEFAARSHQLAAAATAAGRFADEIAPIVIHGRRGDVTITEDEGIRPDTSVNSLATLRPAFAADGTVTAGSSSQLSDGAAALVLTSRDEAERRGLEWLAEIVSYGSVAGPDPSLLLQPAQAIRMALGRASLSVDDLDLVEINEAFASVAVASVRELGVSMDKVNINGGAIAIGHPVGMSGARLILTLAHSLRQRGGGLGVAALCGGGGQGDALIIRVS